MHVRKQRSTGRLGRFVNESYENERENIVLMKKGIEGKRTMGEQRMKGR